MNLCCLLEGSSGPFLKYYCGDTWRMAGTPTMPTILSISAVNYDRYKLLRKQSRNARIVRKTYVGLGYHDWAGLGEVLEALCQFGLEKVRIEQWYGHHEPVVVN